MTPKLAKGTYDTRFNSSPLIDIAPEDPKEPEKETVSSLKLISPLKKKNSLGSSEESRV